MRIYLQKKDERNAFEIFALCALIFLPSINNFINSILQVGMGMNTTGLTETVYVFMLILSLWGFLRNCINNNKLLLFSGFLLILMALSYIIYPEIRPDIYGDPIDLIYNPINVTTFFCIPILFIASSIQDYGELFASMLKWSVLTVVLGVITLWQCVFVAGETLQYMVFSYAILTSICVCFEGYFLEKKKRYLICGILGFVSMFMCGARGAVLAFLIYIVLRVVFFNPTSNNGTRITVLGISIVVLLITLLFYDNIVFGIDALLDSIGIESRFLERLIEGSLLEDRSRSELSNMFVEAIKHNPFGYGALGDRYVTYAFGRAGGATYLHNLFLELICDFGLFIGPIIIVVLIYNLVRALFSKRDAAITRVLWCLVPCGFIQLMFSGSFWTLKEFWVIVVILYGSAKLRRERDF